MRIVSSASSRRRRRSPISSSPATGSSCEVGSSSRSTAGVRRASRRARRAAARRRRARRSGGRAADRSRARARPPRRRARRPPAARPRFSSANASSARTVPITICVSGSWKSVPTARAIDPGRSSRVSMPATWTEPFDLATVEVRHKAAEGPQQRRLSRTGGAGKDDELAGRDLEVDAPERVGLGARIAVAERAHSRPRSSHASATERTARARRRAAPPAIASVSAAGADGERRIRLQRLEAADPRPEREGDDRHGASRERDVVARERRDAP